jgi:hypothetical protein
VPGLKSVNCVCKVEGIYNDVNLARNMIARECMGEYESEITRRLPMSIANCLRVSGIDFLFFVLPQQLTNPSWPSYEHTCGSCCTPFHASSQLTFTLGKSHIRIYHTSCSAFLDLLVNPLPTDWRGTQRLPLRAGSRILDTPPGYTNSQLQRRSRTWASL